MSEHKPFETTHWSIVLAAGGNGSGGRGAMQELCQRYWLPLYAFVRRRGHDEHDAHDLTQGFFQHVLEKGVVEAADRDRGRFRSFLLGSLKNFLSNSAAHRDRIKRGGGAHVASLDLRDAEGQLVHNVVAQGTPESEFNRRWALAVLEHVLDKLAVQYESEGKGDLFEKMRCYLSVDSAQSPYRVVADQLGMKEANVKLSVHRMRRRYRQLLEMEIGATVGQPEDVEAEIRDLFDSLRS